MPLKATKSAFSESGFISSDTSGTPQTQNAYSQIQTITPGNVVGLSFDISSDGNYIAIGSRANANGFAKGAVEIYSNVSNVYTLQTTLYQNTNPNSQYFGESVSLNSDGTYLVVGAPSGNIPTQVPKSYVYGRNGNSWTQLVQLNPSQTVNGSQYGNRVDISQDGNYIVINAPNQKIGNNQSGIIYIYENNNNAWTEQANFFGSNIAFYRLGYSGLFINDDGTVVVAGIASATQNAVPVFTRSGNIWSSYGNLPNANSSTLGMNIDNTANIIITGGGSVYSNKGNWTLTGNNGPTLLSSDANIGFDYGIQEKQGNANGYSYTGNIFYTIPYGQVLQGVTNNNASRLVVYEQTNKKVQVFKKN